MILTLGKYLHKVSEIYKEKSVGEHGQRATRFIVNNLNDKYFPGQEDKAVAYKFYDDTGESKLGSDIELEGFSGKIAAAFYQGEEKAYLAVSKKHSHLLEDVSVECASTDDLFDVKDVGFVSGADKEGEGVIEDENATPKHPWLANFDQENFMDDFLIFHF